jgi:uncharacterized protein (DUF1778 family)
MPIADGALQWGGPPGSLEAARMPTDKNPTSYRLSEEALALIDRLAEALGISRTSVVEMAVRQLARRELGEAARAQGKPRRGRRGKAT